MPDSRLAQFVMPAQMIDEEPYLVVGTMQGMIVLQAKQIRDGGMTGIHYIAWHAELPPMPLRAVKPGESPYDIVPWIMVETARDPKQLGRIRYVWEMRDGKFKKYVLKGEFQLVSEVPEPKPPANENKG